MTALNEVYWPDAELTDVLVDYDTVRISLDCVDGSPRIILAEGYIALSFLPCWDEQVVSDCSVSDDSPLQQSALASLAQSPAFRFDSGSPARNTRKFQTLTLQFADASRLLVVAHAFRVQEGHV